MGTAAGTQLQAQPPPVGKGSAPGRRSRLAAAGGGAHLAGTSTAEIAALSTNTYRSLAKL